MRNLHLTVFTDRPFAGNQLAVFPAPGPLETEVMQAIAKEMAFSETTFIFPPERDGDVKMRIFTPAAELPMAGHPTIGSTFALAIEGTIARGRDEFVFELGVGPTPVSLEWEKSGLSFVWMTQPLPTFGTIVEDRVAMAAALGTDQQSLAAALPIQVVGCGVPFLFVPMASRKAVDGVAIDRRARVRTCGAAGSEELPVFLFTTEAGADEATVYRRMLAPGFGIVEDPATGGASGPLGSYLLHHGIVPAAKAGQILSLQGAATGRPGCIPIAIDGPPARITRVLVGG